ncbi:MAG: YidH family protein [Pirellulaceae bacterium]
MSNDSTSKKTSDELAMDRTDMAGDRTRWAADRTLWAADRTFIAWLRTSLSMIGFGVSIGKAGDVLESQGIVVDSYHGLQITGIAFIVLAVLGLVGALVQDMRIGKRLANQGYARIEPWPLGQVMGFLVLGFGVLGAIFVIL